MAVPVAEGVVEEQEAWGEGEGRAGEEAVAEWAARVRVRLGEGVVVQPVAVESHLPERAWEGERESGENPRRSRRAPSVARGNECPFTGFRPVYLLGRPVEILVMVSPSEDRDGRPILFRGEGVGHCEVRHAVGPERIGGVWWTGHNKTRDYFDVETKEGLRYWIFRVAETGKWYLQGQFG